MMIRRRMGALLSHRSGQATQVILAAAFLAFSSSAWGVQTPEQRAVNGVIPNPSIAEYYLGDLTPGSSQLGFISGAVAGAKASVSWYKYVADGTTPVVFDQFGSNYGFGGGGTFSGGNNGELVLYRPDGTVVASNEAPRAPLRGDSTLRPVPGPGDPPLPAAASYRQSDDPRITAGRYQGGTFYGSNTYNLSQLALINHPQSNPYSATADWDEYGILPAGEYFLAVTGYSTYFSGIARDADTINSWGATYPNADGAVTSSTPFGIVTFHANDGIYQINARKAGDINLDGVINLDDRAALISKIAQYKTTGAMPPEAFAGDDVANGAFLGFSADLSSPETELVRFDLTANHRIDKYDHLEWSRWTSLPASVPGDTDVDGDVDFADLVTLAQNYNRTGDAEWIDGDFDFTASVAFPDLVALAQNYGFGTLNAGSLADAITALPESQRAVFGTLLTQVPEPATLLAAMLPLALLKRVRRTASDQV
jgi:hypothetical protein